MIGAEHGRAGAPSRPSPSRSISRCSACSNMPTSSSARSTRVLPAAPLLVAGPRVAAGDLVLHLSFGLVSHRRPSRAGRRQPQSAAGRGLHRHVPATRGRADHSLSHNRAPARGAPHDARARLGGLSHLRHRARAEGADRGRSRPHRRSRVRQGRTAELCRGMARACRLHDPDLFRLRRLFQHGDRARAGARLRVSAQFPTALYVDARSPNSGAAGTSACRNGCATISTFRWAEAAARPSRPIAIFAWCFCSAACGTARTGPS